MLQLERLGTEWLKEGEKRASVTVWLGGLFLPEAFLTATRQVAARAHSWSLETLELEAPLISAADSHQDIPSSEPSAEGFSVTGVLVSNLLFIICTRRSFNRRSYCC